MKIGIIGAGKVGSCLAIALKQAGWEIGGIYSKSNESASWLTRQIDAIFPNELKVTIECSDIIFISVNDDNLEKISSEIAKIYKRRSGFPLEGKTFFHMSGSKSSEVLTQLKDMGADIGSLHPIQTFVSKEDGEDIFEGITFGMEGDARCQMLSNDIAVSLNSNLWFLRSPEDKPLYHITACLLSNYMTVLMDLACGVLHEMGASPEETLSHFAPMIYSTLDNIFEKGPLSSLSGPIIRGDVKTVSNHLDAIEERVPWLSDPYRILGIYAAAIAGSGDKISPKKYHDIIKLLERSVDNERPKT